MDLLKTQSVKPHATLVLAHGAGAPMDSPFMNAISAELASCNVEVVRFEFAYMAARRTGSRKPPPRADRLMLDFVETVEEIKTARPLFIGGKSMGGRVASLIADDRYRSGRIAGLVCLGYPFHPPAKPDSLRTAHLRTLSAPTLICQGTRDPFGTKDDVSRYGLSECIDFIWLEDGDHDFKPRKRSGLTQADHISAAAEAIANWMKAAADRAG